jgi:CRISPR-associated protein Csh2
VRLKRYIRDYLENFKGEDLFVTNKAFTSKDRVESLIGRKTTKKESLNVKKELPMITSSFIDTRFFGATLGTEGGNDHFTGPIQFNWGYSLNNVELQETKTITSSFSKGEGIGKDFRVKYSFIAFSGSINSKNAEKVNLSEEDVKILDEAMIKSIPLARTRSKIGQIPRLYLRVQLKDGDFFLKDLREFIKLKEKEKLNSISDVKLDLTKLKDYLEENENKIEKVYYYKDNNLNTEGIDFGKSYFEELSFK